MLDPWLKLKKEITAQRDQRVHALTSRLLPIEEYAQTLGQAQALAGVLELIEYTMTQVTEDR